ncbi:MAG: flgE [Proteobacteria bacterium]|nr:flgE [Pseudomonadota bacterium]
MGILSAMNSAVGGLGAQSFALENISGNIANSSTTGFKRKDTSFADLVRSNTSNPARVASGGVQASSRSTITLDGDIQGSKVDTHLAINGTGFFTVSADPLDNTIGARYTRAGDFEQYYDSRNGQTYLRNGSGYSLIGINMTPAVGEDPKGPITIDKTSQSAKASTQITYKLNLPTEPVTTYSTANKTVAGANIYNPNWPAGGAAPISYTISKTGKVVGNQVTDFMNNSISGGTVTVYDAQGTPAVVQLRWAKFDEVPSSPTPATSATVTGSSALPANGSLTSLNSTSFTVSLDGGAAQTITFGAGAFTGATTRSDVATAIQTQLDAAYGAGVVTAKVDATTGVLSLESAAGAHTLAVAGANVTNFFGATNTAVAGTNVIPPSADAGRSEWGLFYRNLETHDASNTTDAVWTQVSSNTAVTNGKLGRTAVNDGGGNVPGSAAWTPTYTNADPTGFFFDKSGKQLDATSAIAVDNLTVGGKNFGTLTLDMGATEFADKNGLATANQLTQDGYSTGAFEGVSIDDNSGVISYNYSNGQTVQKWKIPIAAFNGASYLKAEDGGAYTETIQSGSPIEIDGTLSSSALEASNVDISEEFTKLIVTQQAFSANSKVITTADQMMSDILQIIR